MFDIGATELLLIAVVALLVIGPRDLPRVMRTVGKWMGKARATTKHFRVGFDAMIRESELEEEQKKWAEKNERIMREHPAPEPAEPTPAAETPVAETPAPAARPPDVSTEPEFSFDSAKRAKGAAE